jgi:hypothetical protein
MFPKTDDLPTAAPQPPINKSIASTISLNLWKPVRLIRLMLFAAAFAPPVSMPKFTIAENGDATAHNDKIGFAEDRVLFAIPNSSSPKSLSKHPFNLGAR